MGCFTTPGLSQYVSGVILHWETLFQKDGNGKQLVDMIKENGMIPGIKMDKGYDKAGLPGTLDGPLGHAETWCKGIDDLDKRCAEAYAQGARFAKWRNVLQIDPAKGIPSDFAIDVCVKNLAQYAAICQKNGLVPIVEPEIVPNGSHPVEVCAAITEKVLIAQYAALKPNMVKNGLEGPKATAERIAELTIAVLKRTVPSAVPGIFFLSGETTLDEDNEETATLNLNAMNKMHKSLPWSVSFSYGKALQKTCIVTWMGKEANNSAAQTSTGCEPLGTISGSTMGTRPFFWQMAAYCARFFTHTSMAKSLGMPLAGSICSTFLHLGKRAPCAYASAQRLSRSSMPLHHVSAVSSI